MMIEQIHRDFITAQMQNLAIYDALRPANHIYEFHLHSERVARSTQKLALAAGYTADMADTLYWATLPHDIGKMTLPVTIWDIDGKPNIEQKAERRTHTWRGSKIIRDNFGKECETSPFLTLMIDIMENHHEAMDGSGFLGKTGEQLSREVKMACICDAFDGWSIKRPHFNDRDVSPAGVIHRMETEKTGQFDPDLLDLFKQIQTGKDKA